MTTVASRSATRSNTVAYKRIATEEAWATRELIDLYLKMIENRSSNDPGFDSLWGHYGGGRSERVTQVLERLLDVGERRIGDMDAAGIDKQLLLLTSPGVQLFDTATAVAVAAASNDEAAEAVRKHPDRFAALAAVWLHPGVPLRAKLIRSAVCVAVVAVAFALAARVKLSIDLTEDRRNSFPTADQRAVAELREPLVITVHLAPEDPRYLDLRRNVLSKLERALPRVRIRLAATGHSVVGSAGDEAYGEVEYSYGGRSAKTRSTSHREVLPLLYGLAGKPNPTPVAGEDYPGYALVADGQSTLLWFFVALPLLIVIVWWWSCLPPRIPAQLAKHGGQP